jgi:hypothetical protein
MGNTRENSRRAKNEHGTSVSAATWDLGLTVCFSGIFLGNAQQQAGNYTKRKESDMPLTRKLAAEFIGTFWLVLRVAAVLFSPGHFRT